MSALDASLSTTSTDLLLLSNQSRSSISRISTLEGQLRSTTSNVSTLTSSLNTSNSDIAYLRRNVYHLKKRKCSKFSIFFNYWNFAISVTIWLKYHVRVLSWDLCPPASPQFTRSSNRNTLSLHDNHPKITSVSYTVSHLFLNVKCNLPHLNTDFSTLISL